MRSAFATGVALAVGCVGMAGCHKVASPQSSPWWASATIADLSREGPLRLAPEIGAVCTATVGFTLRDGNLDFSKKGDGFAWVPDSPAWVWAVRVPTAKPAGDWDEDAIQLCLSFKLPQTRPIVLVSVESTGLPVPNSAITAKMDPTHDLVSLSWGDPHNANSRWGGECLARFPFRHASP